MQKRTKISIIIIILAFIISGSFLALNKNNGLAYEIIKVERGDIIQEVFATGTIEPSEKINLAFQNQGRISQINIRVNDQVSIGQILAQLETSELYAQQLEKQAGLQAAQAQLDKILSGASQEEIQVLESKILSSQTSLDNANQNLADIKQKADQILSQAYQDNTELLKNAYIKSEYAINTQIDEMFLNDDKINPQLTFLTSDLQAEIDSEWQRQIAGYALIKLRTEQNLNQAENNLIIIRDFLNKLNQAVLASVNLSQETLNKYKLNINSGLLSINSLIADIISQEQKISSLELENQISLNTAQAQINTTQANLKIAKEELALKLAKPNQADIDLAQAQVAQAQANLLFAQKQIQNSFLIAPISGIIASINFKIGETANSGQTAVSIINSNVLQIETEIPEADIAKIVINNMVDVSLDAFPDQVWPGRVISIEIAPRVVEGVAYYKAIILFDQIDQKIRTGMSADLTIQTNKRENILFIPQRAIFNKNKVRILASKNFKEAQVETGLLSSDGNIEILSGLNQGDKIVIFVKK
ncbi:MAG: efflux RND transporter periplasmic adaptor subunit [bacterium]